MVSGEIKKPAPEPVEVKADFEGEGTTEATPSEEAHEERHPHRVEAKVGENFADAGDFVKEYIEQVEAELQAYEEGIKAVRDLIKGAKKGDHGLGPVRQGMHDLSHGKPLTRTAHVATVTVDGPEQLRKGPAAHSSISSGPGEENNPEIHKRVVGR